MPRYAEVSTYPFFFDIRYMARFSICTAFFNDETKNVDELYDSILQQGVDWEWVVTDDFSEDPSVKDYLIALSGRDTRVRYVEQSHKMEFMRNPAPFALGEFVFQIDSDDLVYRGYLELCERMFSSFPEVGVILAGGQFLDQHGGFRSYRVHREQSICFLGRCWRRSIEIDFSGIIEDRFFTMCNDMFIVRMLGLKSRVLVIPRIFIKYREFVEDGQYKPFSHRVGLSDEMKDANARSHAQFSEYHARQIKRHSSLFPCFEPIGGMAAAAYPLHWLPAGSNLRFVGYDTEWWHERLLEDLYYDMDVSFGNEPLEECINVVDPSSFIEIGPRFKALFHFPEPHSVHSMDFYKEMLGSYGYTKQYGLDFNTHTWLYRI